MCALQWAAGYEVVYQIHRIRLGLMVVSPFKRRCLSELRGVNWDDFGL